MNTRYFTINGNELLYVNDIGGVPETKSLFINVGVLAANTKSRIAGGLSVATVRVADMQPATLDTFAKVRVAVPPDFLKAVVDEQISHARRVLEKAQAGTRAEIHKRYYTATKYTVGFNFPHVIRGVGETYTDGGDRVEVLAVI